MAYAALTVSILALLFTVGSSWFLYARRGTLEATTPRAYAFGGGGELLRLRLPFSFFNTGARALIVEDLRLVVQDDPSPPALRWVTTRDRLRPEKNDDFRYPTPFSVAGRGTRDVIVEFQPPRDLDWSPAFGVELGLQLQAQLHGKSEWEPLASFGWWSPPAESRKFYIAHRNEPFPTNKVKSDL